jgi:hypothetical protein
MSERYQSMTSRSLETGDGRVAELHPAIFIAIKRPIAIGRNWPTTTVQLAVDLLISNGYFHWNSLFFLFAINSGRRFLIFANNSDRKADLCKTFELCFQAAIGKDFSAF